MIVTVGSSALAYYGMSRRTPKDIDLWVCHYSVISCLLTNGNDAVLMPQCILDLVPTENGYATPDAVYTIKCSHFGWNIHWQKTKLDILWLKAKGCKLIPELYSALVAYWKKEHGNKEFLSLKQDKEGFFNDNVTYVYDHDYLHELVAYPDKPMYTKCLREGEDVLIDKAKFATMPFKWRVKMFREEIAAIAIERWSVNRYWKGKVSWHKAYRLALQKTVTNLTKNWATEFIVLNIEEFVVPDYTYFKHAIETLKLRRENMSEILKVFEEVNKAHPDVKGEELRYLILAMATGGYCPEVDFTYENEYPDYSIRKDGEEIYQQLYDAWHTESHAEDKLRDEVKSNLGYSHITTDGGGEGGTEACYGVFMLKGTMYKAEWSYYSHQGYEYDYIVDTLQVVKPVQKTVTVYE